MNYIDSNLKVVGTRPIRPDGVDKVTGRAVYAADTAARASLGAVAPTVLLVKEMADALIGHTLDDATLAKLDAAAQAACKPINDKRGTIEYRTKVAGVLARRTAKIAFDRASGKTVKAH